MQANINRLFDYKYIVNIVPFEYVLSRSNFNFANVLNGSILVDFNNYFLFSDYDGLILLLFICYIYVGIDSFNYLSCYPYYYTYTYTNWPNIYIVVLLLIFWRGFLFVGDGFALLEFPYYYDDELSC